MNYTKACEALNRTPLTIDAFKALPEDQQVSLFGEHKLITCIEVMNMNANNGKKWIPDWLNRNQPKWWNWMSAHKDKGAASGVGFSFDGSGYVGTGTGVGSRLVFISDEVADAARSDTDMLQYYNEWIR